jgi:hypothetical protein
VNPSSDDPDDPQSVTDTALDRIRKFALAQRGKRYLWPAVGPVISKSGDREVDLERDEPAGADE